MKRRSFLATIVGALTAAVAPALSFAGLRQPAAPLVMNVYQLNDYEWFVGPSLQACIERWKRYTGFSDDEAAEYLDDPRQLSDEELDRLKFCHTDEDERPFRSITFRERVAEMVKEGTMGAEFFATTEY